MAFVEKMAPPLELKDESIVLRTPTPEDDSKTQEILNDKAVMSFLLNIIPSSGFTPQMMVERRENHWALQKQGVRLQFTLLKDGVNFGMCGLTHIDLQNRNGEFGIILDKSVWGGGCCGRAFDLIAKFAFEVLKLHRLFSDTRAENVRMIGFFVKRGFKLEGTFKDHVLDADGQFRDVVRYGLLASDYSPFVVPPKK